MRGKKKMVLHPTGMVSPGAGEEGAEAPGPSTCRDQSMRGMGTQLCSLSLCKQHMYTL